MTVQIALKLPEELAARLDALVSAGCFENRTQAIRTGIEAVVAQHERRRIDQALIDGYTAIPPGGLDEWGDLSAQLDAAARHTMARLDAEDGPWVE